MSEITTDSIISENFNDIITLTIAITSSFSCIKNKLDYLKKELSVNKKILLDAKDYIYQSNLSVADNIANFNMILPKTVEARIHWAFDNKKLALPIVKEAELCEHVLEPILFKNVTIKEPYTALRVPLVNYARIFVACENKKGLDNIGRRLEYLKETVDLNKVISNKTLELFNLINSVATSLEFAKKFAFMFSGEENFEGEYLDKNGHMVADVFKLENFNEQFKLGKTNVTYNGYKRTKVGTLKL